MNPGKVSSMRTNTNEWRPRVAAAIAATVLAGCSSGDSGPCASGGGKTLAEAPTLDEPCAVEPNNPTRLLVTTTDFATGAVSVIDLQGGTVQNDVAAATTDSVPAWHDDTAVLVHRFQHDYLEVLDPARDWATAGEFPVKSECTEAPNPQSVAFGPDGLAYVPQLASPDIAVLDLQAKPAEALVDTIDLGAFADDDGNPEASLAITCGETLWVSVQHLDPSFVRVGDDELVAIDLVRGRAFDLDEEEDGGQGIRSAGEWIRQLRRDPTDTAGHRVLALSTGIERIDLAARTVEWAVAPSVFADVGLEGMRLLQSFDVTEDGTIAYVAAYSQDFAQVSLWRVGLDGASPTIPESFAGGFDSVERTLELAGDRLWYGSTRPGAAGLWTFDVSQWPPVQSSAPLALGLPPYSLLAIP
jgi:hypothetical protein